MSAPPNKNSDFDSRVNERTRELLENFDVVGTRLHLAIVPRGEYLSHLRENVQAAIVASTLNLRSIDYAKQRYCHPENNEASSGPMETYIAAYRASKEYMVRILKKIRTEGRPDPTVGVFGASLVLQRLEPSFFCAHLLYQLGHAYEGHAVSRLILEQIAWAYVAYELNDLDAIEKIETTRAISQLKKFVPHAGKLYGFLSKNTHIDYSRHSEFLRFENGENMVLHSHLKLDEFGHTILLLADMFGLVWERSQLAYIDTPETITISNPSTTPNPQRPFALEMNKHIEAIKTALLESNAAPQGS